MSTRLALIVRRLGPRYSAVVQGLHKRAATAPTGSAVVLEGMPERSAGIDRLVSPNADLLLVIDGALSDDMIDSLAALADATQRPVTRLEWLRHVGAATDPLIITLGPAITGAGDRTVMAQICRVIVRALTAEIQELQEDRRIGGTEWASLRDQHVESLAALSDARSLRDSTSFRLGHLLVSIVRAPHRLISTLHVARSTRHREIATTLGEAHRPDRSRSPRHIDHELLWRWQKVPQSPFLAVIGQRYSPADAGQTLHLSPHDATALIANSAPTALLIDARAGDVGHAWTGIGADARPHLKSELSRVVALARRIDLPVVAWRTRPPATLERWFDDVIDRADIVLADPRVEAGSSHVTVAADSSSNQVLDAVLSLLPSDIDR